MNSKWLARQRPCRHDTNHTYHGTARMVCVSLCDCQPQPLNGCHTLYTATKSPVCSVLDNNVCSSEIYSVIVKHIHLALNHGESICAHVVMPLEQCSVAILAECPWHQQLLNFLSFMGQGHSVPQNRLDTDGFLIMQFWGMSSPGVVMFRGQTVLVLLANLLCMYGNVTDTHRRADC